MLGLDDRIASLGEGGSVGVVLLVAVLLGLRHATDPDHVAAMTSLVAGARERAARSAGRLGLAWGLGHAVTLFAFGLPVVLYGERLPPAAQRGAETLVALVIVALAVRLLVRWRRGHFHVHEHEHDGRVHRHLHAHESEGGEAHAHAHRPRSPRGAFAIGLVHGVGGSAGVGVLLLATVDSRPLAAASLVLLAVFTAVSMTVLSTGFGSTLVSRPVRGVLHGVVPALGLGGLAFGVWYGLGALELAPYAF